MCKRFTSRWYSSGTNTTAMSSYKPSVASKMLPEMKMIYQVFGLLATHMIVLERITFTLDFVTSCEDKIDVTFIGSKTKMKQLLIKLCA